jgi:serine protease AprX
MSAKTAVPPRNRRPLGSSLFVRTAVVALLALPAAASAQLQGPDLSHYDTRPPDLVWQELVRLHKVPPTIDGRGVGVALIDSGVANVPDLRGNVLARVDFTEERDGLDTFGHGTHMAGLIVGDGTASAGQWVGSAPGADLISLKVASWNGATDTSSVIAALRWVVTNKARYNIRVINLSFGTDGRQSYRSDPLDRAVERAWEAGIVVVVSAGNLGPLAGSVSKPGDDPRILTVGAFDDENSVLREDDHIPDFSSRGLTQDGVEKPEIVAPGVSIVSLRAPGSTIDTFRATARLDQDYFKGTGTSQASAIVAGVAARVIGANPGLTPDEVKGILIDTANDNLVGLPGAGHGAVDARKAVEAAQGIRGWKPLESIPARGTGTGTLSGTRGSGLVFADLNRDGISELVTGETEVLGVPYRSSTVATLRWTPQTWASSPWAAVAVETPGFAQTAPGTAAWKGASPDAESWSAKGWAQAGWDAKGWAAKGWAAALWN